MHACSDTQQLQLWHATLQDLPDLITMPCPLPALTRQTIKAVSCPDLKVYRPFFEAMYGRVLQLKEGLSVKAVEKFVNQ